jgi:hypothetical protein
MLATTAFVPDDLRISVSKPGIEVAGAGFKSRIICNLI